MRLVVKVVVVVILALGISNYLIYLNTGRLPLSEMREQFSGDWLAGITHSFSADQVADKAKQTLNDLTGDESANGATAKVYKWTDADGRVHYGDKAPASGAQQVEVKIQNAISDEAPQVKNTEPAADNAEQSPLEKARAAAEIMRARAQEQQAQ